VMQVAYQDFKQATFAEIAKPYQQADYDLGAIIHSDVFQILQVDNPKRRLDRVAYPEGQMHGYYLLGIPYLGRDPTDTENWVMPALLGMLSPLLFGTKAVVSDSMLPLYTSGADFPETVVLDGPHSFWQHGIKKTTFRLDELEESLHAALALYGLVSEAYKDSKNYIIWNQLGPVARNLDSDALSIFGYADRISSQASKGKSTVTSTDGMAPWLAQRLMMYYKHITNYYQKYQLGGENEMELIKETVEKYTTFYRAKGSKGRSASAYSRLRPLNIAIDTILRLPTTDELDDQSLQLQINGGLLAFLDRIRGGDKTITGFIPKGMSKNEVLYPAVVAFTHHVVEEVLGRYCNNDRAILRKRLNDLKNGCEAYYVLNFTKKDDSETEEMEMN
jgi:CRISPR-associated protein Csc3